MLIFFVQSRRYGTVLVHVQLKAEHHTAVETEFNNT